MKPGSLLRMLGFIAMADLAYALSRIAVTVNGRTLSGLRGASNPETMDSTPSRIMAGGKKAIGFNEYPDANAMDYGFSIAAPHGDEQFLDALVEGTADVTLSATYIDVTDWPVGAFTGVSGRGKLSRGGQQLGDEIGEISYVVHMNGTTRTYNGAPSITKP